jgi:hypothetical protein
MKIAWVLCLVVACGGNDNSRHIADGNGSGSGDGSGMPEPCNMMISSTKITTTATGTQCGQQLVNQTTFAINFSVTPDASNMAISEIACTITPGVVPQTLGNRSGTMGCNVEVDYYGATGDDEWDNSSSGTVTVTVTDLAPLGGTIDLSLSNAASEQLTVTGTF